MKLTPHTGRMWFGEPRRHLSKNLNGDSVEGRVNASCISLRFGPGMLSLVSVLTCITYLYFSLVYVCKASFLLPSVGVLHTTLVVVLWKRSTLAVNIPLGDFASKRLESSNCLLWYPTNERWLFQWKRFSQKCFPRIFSKAPKKTYFWPKSAF